MSIAVNPPPQQGLPLKLLNDRELSPFFLYQQEYLFKLWQRSGGGTDLVAGLQDQIDAINIEITAIKARLDAIEARLDALEARATYLEGLTIVTAIDLTIDNTVTGHQSIICTAAVTISLDATPNDRDTAVIKVGQKNTRVIIDGNGKLIEQDGTMVLRPRNTKRQTGMALEYSATFDKWFST